MTRRGRKSRKRGRSGVRGEIASRVDGRYKRPAVSLRKRKQARARENTTLYLVASLSQLQEGRQGWSARGASETRRRRRTRRT